LVIVIIDNLKALFQSLDTNYISVWRHMQIFTWQSGGYCPYHDYLYTITAL